MSMFSTASASVQSARRDGLERIQVQHQQVDGADAIRGHHRVVDAGAAQQAAVHQRMRVLTRPSIISGKPVTSSLTSFHRKAGIAQFASRCRRSRAVRHRAPVGRWRGRAGRSCRTRTAGRGARSPDGRRIRRWRGGSGHGKGMQRWGEAAIIGFFAAGPPGSSPSRSRAASCAGWRSGCPASPRRAALVALAMPQDFGEQRDLQFAQRDLGRGRRSRNRPGRAGSGARELATWSRKGARWASWRSAEMFKQDPSGAEPHRAGSSVRAGSLARCRGACQAAGAFTLSRLRRVAHVIRSGSRTRPRPRRVRRCRTPVARPGQPRVAVPGARPR